MPGTVVAERVRRRGRGRGRVLFALGFALAAHAGLLTLFRFVGPTLGADGLPVSRVAAGSASAALDRPMEISSLVETLRAPDAPTPEERLRAEAAKKEEERKDLNGQIVDIARPAIEQRPTEARFLAEHDSRVDHEQRGPRGRDQAGALTPSQPSAPTPPKEAPSAASGGGGRAGAPGQQTQVASVARRQQPAEAHDGLTAADDGELRRRVGSASGEAREQASREGVAARAPLPSGVGGESGDGQGEGEASGQKRTDPRLAVTPEMLQRAIGAGSGSMDYLKDLEDGESTALNAKKFKFAAFFNRVKRAVAQEWNPTAIYVRNDPSGNVYGVKDRITVLRVHLAPDGRLVGSNVIQSSGVGFLDDEAQDAFRRAQPYANPPKDLLESDAQVHFTFAFIFELSGHTSFKVYKYR